MAENTFDLIIIGAGPGGYVAAIRAAQLGMRVACVEKHGALGGTCLNVGCIPSKALLDSSELYFQARHRFALHGIRAEVSLDLPAMMKRKDRVVATLTRGVQGLFRRNKIEHVRGHGRLAGRGRVEVTGKDGKRALLARNILIATGSAPIELPALKYDGRRIVNSDQAIAFDEVPKKLIVIGAGAIGLELGSVWSRLGSEVIVLEFLDRILPLMDREVTAQLQKHLEKQGLTFRLNTTAESAKVTEDNVRLRWKSGEETGEEECDRLLVAVGRRPFTDDLGLDTAGVRTDRRGFITVDPRTFQTDVNGVFAIGDVIGGAMLAHKAEEEGIAAVERMAGHAGHVNYPAMPNIVYTFPEVASVGLTEEEARQDDREVRIGKFPFSANGRARALDAAEGFVKIIADAETDRMLGMTILGPRASDIIAEGALAMEFAASVEDIARSVHAHPTLPEAIREAALAADKRAIHI